MRRREGENLRSLEKLAWKKLINVNRNASVFNEGSNRIELMLTAGSQNAKKY